MTDVYQCVVTENYDKENKGTITVKVPVMEDGRDIFAQVRVLTQYGGAGHGSLFMPEIGDLVAVAFTGGDFNRGIVLGSLYVPKNSFVENRCAEKNINKCIVTKGGSSIAFSDKEDNLTITVSTPKNQTITLDSKNENITVTAKSGTDITVDGKNGTVTVNAKEGITLKCGNNEIIIGNQNITVKGGNIKLDGPQIEIKGSAKTDISGQQLNLKGTQAKLTADGQLEVSASGITQVRGSMVKLN
jgi:uncharacterized protein involved in type VI secretion and phage assembly